MLFIQINRVSKTVSTIQDFFRHYRPQNEMHELAMSQYCARRRLTVSIDQCADQRQPISFEQFKEWFEREQFCRGDVVSLPEEGITGIVELMGVNRTVRLYVSYRDGVLETHARDFRYTTLLPATSAAAVELQRAFNARGLLWNRYRSRLKPAPELRNNQLYQISVLGCKVGYGVFREVDAEGRIVMYCFKPEGAPVRYSLREVIGPRTDYQLEKVNVFQRQSLSRELEQAGVVWHGFYKRIEPVDYLLPPGAEYYFLTELWDVRSAVGRWAKRSLKYFNQGNYFRTREEAEQLQQVLLRCMEDRVFVRAEGKTYYYLKKLWKISKAEDCGASKDLKRAGRKNYFPTEREALEVCTLLRTLRNDQLAGVRRPGK